MIKCPLCCGDGFNMGINGPYLCAFCEHEGKVINAPEGIWAVDYNTHKAFRAATKEETKHLYWDCQWAFDKEIKLFFYRI